MKPYISVCMIVKNEEKVLRRCLESIYKIVDEIIIVDTGSSDNTVKISQEFTEKLYYFEWENNFSTARNYSISKASGEWILVLDADEYVDSENLKSMISKMRNNNSTNGYLVTIVSFLGNHAEDMLQHKTVRLFRNTKEFTYQGIIHEQPVYGQIEKLRLEQSILTIYHSGYLNSTTIEKKKQDRNIKLLMEEVNNGRENSFIYFYLANEYSALKDYNNALNFYKLAFSLKKDINETWIPMGIVKMIICLIELERFKDALDLITSSNEIWTNSPDLYYLEAYIFFLQNDYLNSKLRLLNLINNQEKFMNVIVSDDFKERKPLILMAIMLEKEGRYVDSFNNLYRVLQLNQSDPNIKTAIIRVINKMNYEDKVVYLQQIKHLL